MSAYSDLVISKSPLVYWQLDEAVPGTGTAADSSGNGRNGTYTGSPTAVAALTQGAASAVDFNGGTQWVTSSYNPFAVDTSLTFECWLQRHTSGTADTMWGSDAASNMVLFRFSSGSDTIGWFPANAGSVSWSSTGIQLDTTYHIVLAWDGIANAARLYINGNGLAQKTVGSDFNASPGNLSVATRGSTHSEPFDGTIGQFAIYNGILSPDSILENYVVGSAPPLAWIGA